MELWGNAEKMWKVEKSKINESRRLVAGQRKYGGILVEADVVLAELLVEALHGTFGRVVVLA